MNPSKTSHHIEIAPEAASELERLISASQRIVIYPHTAPDGDALGSTLSLRRTILNRYPDKAVCVVSPDAVDAYLSWLPDLDTLYVYTKDEARAIELTQQADLLIHLDHNQRSRLRYTPLLEAAKQSSAPSVLIDHHLYPDADFDLSFSYPGTSSTCELLLSILQAIRWGDHIDATAATLLLTGMITDTGRFMYGCFSSDFYRQVANVVDLGANYNFIIDQLSYHGRAEQLKAMGYVLHEKLEMHADLGAALFVLTREEMERLGITKGDTEGLVNLPLSVEGIRCSCFIREDATQIKLSFRSTGDFPANLIAERGFSGGGHLNAAGAEHHGTVEEAKNIYLYQLKRLIQEGF